MTTSPTQGEHAQPVAQSGSPVFGDEKIDANALEAMAKARPQDFFLKGSGVLKLTQAIRELEAKNRRLHAQVAAQPASPVAQAVVWPAMPGRAHYQVNKPFHDGYDKGWTECLQACQAAFAETEHVPAVVSTNGAESNMTGGAVPDWIPFSKRMAIADRHGVKVTDEFNDLVRDIISTYLETHAATAQAAPAGATIARVVLGADDKPASNVHLVDKGDELDAELFDATYPLRAPHRIANLVERPTAQAAPTSEWDVRGHLAASLTCWHRLTGKESDELVALFQGRAAPAAGAVAGPGGWHELAAKVFDALADAQEKTNANCPAHVNAYPSWRIQARWLRWHADMFRTGKPVGNGAGQPAVLAALAAAPTPAAQADSVDSPAVSFDDARVQSAYDILCDGATPPTGEHWEGFSARRIVDALAAQADSGVQEDAARWREALRHVGAAHHLGGQHFTLNTLPISDQMYLMRGSVAQHFTKCIDDSRAALAAKGEKHGN